MKRNMKKLAAALMIVVCMFAMTACSAGDNVGDASFYQGKADGCIGLLTGFSQADLQAEIESLEENYDDFEQQIALYPYISGTGVKYDFTAEAYLSMVKAYEASLEDLGAFVQLKEYEECVEDDGEVSFSAVYTFEKHDLRMSFVFDKDDVIQSVSVDPIYSTGEILTKAGLNTILGMGSVFVVLILISLIISCFNFIPKIQGLFGKKAAPAPAPKKEVAPAPVAAPVVEEQVDDLEVIAVITAAVAAAMGTSTDGFVVRSIRRSNSNKWRKA